jgi:hypothetical protein
MNQHGSAVGASSARGTLAGIILPSASCWVTLSLLLLLMLPTSSNNSNNYCVVAGGKCCVCRTTTMAKGLLFSIKKRQIWLPLIDHQPGIKARAGRVSETKSRSHNCQKGIVTNQMSQHVLLGKRTRIQLEEENQLLKKQRQEG